MGEWGSYCTNTTPQTIWVSNAPPPVALRGWLKCTVRFHCLPFYKHHSFAVEGYFKVGFIVHQYYMDWFENDISSQCYYQYCKQTSFCSSQCSATFNEMAFLTAQSSFKFYINNYLTSSWGMILLPPQCSKSTCAHYATHKYHRRVFPSPLCPRFRLLNTQPSLGQQESCSLHKEETERYATYLVSSNN